MKKHSLHTDPLVDEILKELPFLNTKQAVYVKNYIRFDCSETKKQDASVDEEVYEKILRIALCFKEYIASYPNIYVLLSDIYERIKMYENFRKELYLRIANNIKLDKSFFKYQEGNKTKRKLCQEIADELLK